MQVQKNGIRQPVPFVHFQTSLLLCLCFNGFTLFAGTEATFDPQAVFTRALLFHQEGEMLEQQGQSKLAFEKFQSAQQCLVEVQTKKPGWQTALIQYRMKQIEDSLKKREEKRSPDERTENFPDLNAKNKRIGLPHVPAVRVPVATKERIPEVDAFEPIQASPAEIKALFLAFESKSQARVTELLQNRGLFDVVDSSGRTPLMLAVMAGWIDLSNYLIQNKAALTAQDFRGWTAWNCALALKKPEIARQIFDALGQKTEWNTIACQQFAAALSNEDLPTVDLLYRNLTPEPVIENSVQPLLIWAIAWRNVRLVQTLLEAGANPNGVLRYPVESVFKQQLDVKTMSPYLDQDRGITALMVAAAIGDISVLDLLLNRKAERGRITARYHQTALAFAAANQNIRAMQLLLGINLKEADRVQIEISLTTQRAFLFKDGKMVFETKCSTGREGYETPIGTFVITDKDRLRVSNLYHAAMPYFMRLSGSAVGMHQGEVPDYPASHGCIRLPDGAAHRLYSEIPVGTKVVISP